MDQKILSEENAYLDESLELIQKQIDIITENSSKLENVFDASNSEYLEYLKKNSNKINEEDVVELVNMQGRLEDLQTDSIDYKREKETYFRMLDKPYFARIDIDSDDTNYLEKYYIGIHSLVNDQKEYKIIDWRSPISSIFYNYEQGPCKIVTNSSILNCNLLNKRQFGIEKGKLKYYIDTTINIEDQLLQEALAKNTSSKMKSIVQTIQKEQNEIIRGDENKNLIVQGVAGSGKTAIALHRIAYLLYKLKGKIRSENIMFISPNNAFSSYISSVLPDLAEDDIDKIQLDLYAREILKKHLILEKKYEQIERLIETKDLSDYRYKTSVQFLEDILEYAKKNYIDNFDPKDFEMKDININTNKIKELFFGRYSDRDLFTRFKWITDNIFDSYYYKVKSVEKIKRIKELIFIKLYKLIENKNCVKAYMNFLKSKNLKLELVGNKVKNEDAYGILFFKLFIYGLEKYDKIKHLVIDEMQDYSPLQLHIIDNIFDCPKTILGDYNQALNPTDIKSYWTQNKDDYSLLTLNKSYRSTVEIADFYNFVGNKKDSNVVGRHGEKVDIILSSNEKVVSDIKKSIDKYHEMGFKSIAIITKSNKEAVNLFDKVKNEIANINLIDDNIDSYDNNLCIISAYNSKGLEFDAVIVYNVSDNYNDDIDRNILYIASTRALHGLTLLGIDNLSKFLLEYKEKL